MVMLALALAHAGFIGLALAMDRHAARIPLIPPMPGSARWPLRLTGLALLLASGWLSLLGWGTGPGSAGWFGLLTLAGLLLALGLALWPRQVAVIALLLLTLGLMLVDD
ncbi:conserved membrane protein of unknown function [Rhodovastum atsumiense]|uniref:DUF3325 family protein n=1 Tax=Rhodovastum atsumiense TaxID=504468 RepID=A0A5M6ILE3_9PROT|nr:DUF3325 family protein [Rhodovastum atsumiense]KAA5609093.1 DUF3325 family protein [Rhodovastum atsumiense]CAH2602153.1 conserved membrane protein of unknown function [Rhodovastum atsumiense]